MEPVIKTTDAVFGGLTYLDGLPVKCSLFVSIRRARKYAYLRIRRGDMELAGSGVAWIGDEPHLEQRRVPLSELDTTVTTLLRGY